jgi:hypothetical protein
MNDVGHDDDDYDDDDDDDGSTSVVVVVVVVGVLVVVVVVCNYSCVFKSKYTKRYEIHKNNSVTNNNACYIYHFRGLVQCSQERSHKCLHDINGRQGQPHWQHNPDMRQEKVKF